MSASGPFVHQDSVPARCRCVCNVSLQSPRSWFAYISQTEPCLLEDVLVTPKHSLVKQVSDHYLPKLLPHEHDENSENDVKARNVVMNFDGLGVVWYTSSKADFESSNTAQSSDGKQKDVSSCMLGHELQCSPSLGPTSGDVQNDSTSNQRPELSVDMCQYRKSSLLWTYPSFIRNRNRKHQQPPVRFWKAYVHAQWSS